MLHLVTQIPQAICEPTSLASFEIGRIYGQAAKKATIRDGDFLVGLPARIRTADLQSRSLTRYPAVPQVDIQFFQVVLSVLKDLQSLPLAQAKRYVKGKCRGK